MKSMYFFLFSLQNVGRWKNYRQTTLVNLTQTQMSRALTSNKWTGMMDRSSEKQMSSYREHTITWFLLLSDAFHLEINTSQKLPSMQTHILPCNKQMEWPAVPFTMCTAPRISQMVLGTQLRTREFKFHP